MKYLTEFSKGRVKTKYRLIIPRFGSKRKFSAALIFCLMFFMVIYIAMKINKVLGFLLIITLPFVTSKLYSLVFSFDRTNKLLLFEESELSIVEEERAEVQIAYKEIKELRIKICIEKANVNDLGFDFFNHKAYTLNLLTISGESYELNVLAELHETKEDKLQFTTIPPSLCLVLKYLKKKNKKFSIRSWKGQNFDYYFN